MAAIGYMEQLKRPILSFEANAERRDGSVAPFVLRIFEPDFQEGRGNFCRVECPYLREEPFRIFGVDPAQACELSTFFIEQAIKDDIVRLLDPTGQEIQIPKVPWPQQDRV